MQASAQSRRHSVHVQERNPPRNCHRTRYLAATTVFSDSCRDDRSSNPHIPCALRAKYTWRGEGEMLTLHPIDVIQHKRDGLVLSDAEIDAFIRPRVSRDADNPSPTDAQTAALLLCHLPQGSEPRRSSLRSPTRCASPAKPWTRPRSTRSLSTSTPLAA